LERGTEKKNVSIYRTLSTGTIEEKIFQRQITKKALSNSVVEGQTDNAPDFDQKSLKDIFTYRQDTLCDTHDMLGCRCSNAKRIPPHQRQKVKIDELASYEHYDDISSLKDSILQQAAEGLVSFVLANNQKLSPEPQNSSDGEGIVNEIAVSLEDSDNSCSSRKQCKVDVDADCDYEPGMDMQVDEKDSEDTKGDEEEEEEEDSSEDEEEEEEEEDQ